MAKVIDVAEIGKTLDVPAIAGYGPNGEGPFYNQVWSKQYVLRLLEDIRQDTEGDDYILTGHVDPWVFIAVIDKLKADNIYFRVPAGDTKLEPMKRGACRYDDIITVTVDGDDAYVKADFDDLEKIVGGPRNVNLDELAVPEVPAGANVYFHGIGKFPFQMAVAYTLMDGCGSFSAASGNAESYCCAIPGGPVKEVGDEKSRI